MFEPDESVAAYSQRLLDDYLTVAGRRDPTALHATALRTGSVSARHILARAATSEMSYEQLVQGAVDGRRIARLNIDALTDLASVTALQRLTPDDVAQGLALYDLALRSGSPRRIGPRHQAVHVQLAVHHGDRATVKRLLRSYRSIPALTRSAVELDATNPFVAAASQPNTWLARFSALLPPTNLSLSEAEAAPLDRLYTTTPTVDADRKVTVVVSAYRPDLGLLTSVRSLLAQSWSNLEILVVDDASPAEYDDVLTRCAELDDRVRFLRLPRNSGTYTARNTALDVARGDFITFHDSDDWAHPRRIETHARLLMENPALQACVSHALTVTDDLVITKPGRSPKLLCTPSLMFRTAEVAERLGYFDSIRKAADTEYMRRIQAVFGSESVRRMGQVFTLMRQGAGSLSRAEFRPGWKHPAREAYQSAYLPWHRAIKAGTADPHLDHDAAIRPFAVPRRFAKNPPKTTAYDVVLACDWRPFGGPQKSMLEEIAALTGAGLKVAVMHLESYRHMTQLQKPLCDPIQEFINDGTVDQVLPTDDVSVRLLVLRYPPILQFRAGESTSIRPRRLVILANQAPSEMDGSDLRYIPSTCTDNAREMFGIDPVWYPQGPAARAALQPHLDGDRLAVDDMPGIIDTDATVVERDGFRSDLPVIGRHSRDDPTKWPRDSHTLLQLYPDSPDVDVRIMGGAKSAVALLDTDHRPRHWIVYERGELDVANFLHQLDFFVYFPHPNMIEAFGRAILEALAAGCVTILPDRFEPVFGDAAVYCRPEEVPNVVAGYRSNVNAFLVQSRRGQQRVRERFSHESYLALIEPLLTDAPDGTAPRAPAHSGTALCIWRGSRR